MMELTTVIISSAIVIIGLGAMIGFYYRKTTRLNHKLENKDKELEEKNKLIAQLEKVIEKQDQVLDLYRQEIK